MVDNICHFSLASLHCGSSSYFSHCPLLMPAIINVLGCIGSWMLGLQPLLGIICIGLHHLAFEFEMENSRTSETLAQKHLHLVI